MVPPLAFDTPAMLSRLVALDDAALDALPFGVIAFDAAGIARRYNARESRFSGLAPARVIGSAFFTDIAQCMNNYLVAQRYEDAAAAGAVLDLQIDYVLTWRMRPTPVQMRLLWAPGTPWRYLLIRHPA